MWSYKRKESLYLETLFLLRQSPDYDHPTRDLRDFCLYNIGRKMEQQGDTVQNDYDCYVQDWKLQCISNGVVIAL